tara:strand:- start:1052 stop:1288 length:237 start_codon:yes stop_codon:yes gene_type:complete
MKIKYLLIVFMIFFSGTAIGVFATVSHQQELILQKEEILNYPLHYRGKGDDWGCVYNSWRATCAINFPSCSTDEEPDG